MNRPLSKLLPPFLASLVHPSWSWVVVLLVCTGSTPAQPQVESCSGPLGPTVGQGALIETMTIADNWTIADVECRVDITHPFIGQLTVDLISPGFTTVRLHDEGGVNADNIRVNYNDQGVMNGVQPYDCDCAMQPAGFGTMADYSGGASAGDWILTVTDSFTSMGSLDDWCVRVFSDDPVFLRGDVDFDGSLLLNDGVFILRYLFVPLSIVPICLDTADVNDDGVVDLSDSLFLLNYLFVPGSAVPPAPGIADCSNDPTPDSLPQCFQGPGCP